MNLSKKKPIIITAIVILLIITLLSACGGNVNKVNITDVTSDIYSEQEIKAGQSVVLNYFKNEFSGCKLTELQYIGDEKNNEFMEFATRNDSKDVMVFISNFDVDSSGGDGSLNPNSTYTNWNWILVKNSSGKWEHIDHGY